MLGVSGTKGANYSVVSIAPQVPPALASRRSAAAALTEWLYPSLPMYLKSTSWKSAVSEESGSTSYKTRPLGNIVLSPCFLFPFFLGSIEYVQEELRVSLD